ncbi:MAG: hypothetical protein PHD72_04685 [Patescibacteria group bacterium]|nr:hypothetical protein [Patescibacteria group bacterium]
MLQKTTKIALIIAGFVMALSFISSTFDGDFGWHLRFGMDAFAGNWQYTDSYTWPYFGQPWTNHEWGGDLLFWLLYSNLGYFSLVVLVATAVWGAILLTQKIFFKKLTSDALIFSLVALLAAKFLLSMRLAWLAPLFFVLLWHTLEKIPRKKTFYWWPLILWAWSALHGSWILGFIVLNIYIAGNALALLLKNKFPKISGADTGWTLSTIKNAIFWQIISWLAVLANPYGIKIWQEVGSYFTQNYFKQVVNEWLPSYAYPVYIWPLVFAAFSVIIIFLGWKQKKISLAQIILFIAIFSAAWQYKRNNIYLVLVCLPIITATWEIAKGRILTSAKNAATKISIATSGLTIFAALVIIFYSLSHTYWTNNIWRERVLLERYPFPFGAAEFLKQETAGQKIYVFNEFWWGGYLNWALPNALVFLDGRGTATWRYDEKTTMLEEYRKIKYDAGGFQKLESSPAQYVILSKNLAGYPKPNFINRIIFDQKDFDKIFSDNKSQIEKMLERSKNWQIVYEDKTTRVWSRTLP